MVTENEIEKLNNLILKSKKLLEKLPKTDLHISKTHGTLQYYTILEKGVRHYISKRNSDELAQFAQKFYLKKLLQTANENKKKILTLVQTYNPKALEMVYDTLDEDLKSKIQKLVITNNEYAEKWASVKYETKGIQEGKITYVTDNGEKVRSKSELTIANKLFHNGVKYRYEFPHYIEGIGTIFPDFLILNQKTREEIIWEHFGLMDYPEYLKLTLKKLQIYALNGIFPGKNLIITFETSELPINTILLDKIIEEYLK